MPLDELRRRLPDDCARACLDRRRLRERDADRRRSRSRSTARRWSLDIDHHHDNTRFGDDQSDRSERLVDRRGPARRLRGARRRADAGDRGGALHRARHGHRTVSVLEHDRRRRSRLAAELVEAGADVHAIFQQCLRDGAVREAEAARPRARAGRRSTTGGGWSSRTCCGATSRTSARPRPYSEGIIDYLRAVEGADMAALIREPPGRARRDGSVAALEQRRARRLRDRARVGRRRSPRRRPASRATIRSRRSPSSSRASSSRSVPPRALEPSGVVARRQAGGARRRSRSSRQIRGVTGARTGHAGTLDPFATGLLLLLSGAATKLAPCFVGLDKRYVTDVDLTRARRRAIPEGEVVERLEPPGEAELAQTARAPPRRDRAADPRRLGGEDRR